MNWSAWFLLLVAPHRGLFAAVRLTTGILFSALLWLTMFALRAWQYAPACWRSREDGLPG